MSDHRIVRKMTQVQISRPHRSKRPLSDPGWFWGGKAFYKGGDCHPYSPCATCGFVDTGNYFCVLLNATTSLLTIQIFPYATRPPTNPAFQITHKLGFLGKVPLWRHELAWAWKLNEQVGRESGRSSARTNLSVWFTDWLTHHFPNDVNRITLYT